MLQNQKTTRANNKGVLAIDDTACPKPHAEKTEGASIQYCGCLGKEENANVAVASCFVSNSKHFPVDFKSYLPITTPNPQNFKSKLDLAKELIAEAIAKGIPFKSVVTDIWYTSTDLIEFVASLDITLVAEVKINRSIFFTHPATKQWRYLTADKIIPLIKQFYPHKLKAVNIPRADGNEKSVLTYSFKSKLRDCSTEVQVIFIFDKWSKSDDKDIHVLITTDLNMSVRSAIFTYLLRWGIENRLENLKMPFVLIGIGCVIRSKSKNTGLCHSWLGRLPIGSSRTAASLRYLSDPIRLSASANTLSLPLSSSTIASCSQRTKNLLLNFTTSNLDILKKN